MSPKNDLPTDPADLLAEVILLREMLSLWEICRGCFITYDACTCDGGGEE